MPVNKILTQIIHDLRNMKVLNNDQLNFILDLSDNDKNEIILLYYG